MSRLATRTLLGVALVTLGACGSDATGVVIDDLVGTWSATSFVITSVADPSISGDALQGGISLTLDIMADGSFVSTISQQGQQDEVATGTIDLNGNKITLNLQAEVDHGTVSVNGDMMTIKLTSGLTEDFGNGQEAATAVIKLTRT